MDSQRSNTATRLRKLAATIFGVNALDMNPSTTRQEKFRNMIGWTTNEHGRGSYSALKVEILHRDYSGVYDRQKVFLNLRLMAVRFSYQTVSIHQLLSYFSAFRCSYPWTKRGNRDGQRKFCSTSYDRDNGSHSWDPQHNSWCNCHNGNACKCFLRRLHSEDY